MSSLDCKPPCRDIAARCNLGLLAVDQQQLGCAACHESWNTLPSKTTFLQMKSHLQAEVVLQKARFGVK